MVVLLHNIRSVHNVGSIFRTADAAGIDKIYLCGITPSPLDRFGRFREQFVKVSLGAEKTVAWEKSRRAGDLIKKLREKGFKIIAVEQEKKAIPYFKFKVKNLNKAALVFGNEVSGLPITILKKCDNVLEIPMRGRKESLNVAVAFAVIVFHLRIV